MKSTFKCYICEIENKFKDRTLTVGSGFFTYYICKKCHKQNGYITLGDHQIQEVKNLFEYVN